MIYSIVQVDTSSLERPQNKCQLRRLFHEHSKPSQQANCQLNAPEIQLTKHMMWHVPCLCVPMPSALITCPGSMLCRAAGIFKDKLLNSTVSPSKNKAKEVLPCRCLLMSLDDMFFNIEVAPTPLRFFLNTGNAAFHNSGHKVSY